MSDRAFVVHAPRPPLALLAAVALALILPALPARAAFITFNGAGISNASGSTLSSSVTFGTSGTDLVVTLTNTSTADVLQQGDILTAVFFDVSGSPLNLSSGSAVLNSGSTVLFGTSDPGGVVGGEWAYGQNISSSLFSNSGGMLTQQYGISSSGLGVFGGSSFPGSNLQGPAAVDGVQFGIDSAGDNPATGQSAVTGKNDLIQNSVIFTLMGLPVGFDPASSINDVVFQYGTSLTSDTHVPSVPEPATVGLVGIGLLLASTRRRRRARRLFHRSK